MSKPIKKESVEKFRGLAMEQRKKLSELEQSFFEENVVNCVELLEEIVEANQDDGVAFNLLYDLNLKRFLYIPHPSSDYRQFIYLDKIALFLEGMKAGRKR